MKVTIYLKGEKLSYPLGCSEIQDFAQPTTHLRGGYIERIQKDFFILTKFRGSSGHLKFDHFYIVDFHSALTFLERDLWFECFFLTEAIP